MSVPALLLTQKAEVKPIKLSLETDGRVTLATLQKALKKKEAPTEVGTYTYRNLTLFLFGFTKGRTGTENKHELPPPLDQSQFFGDLLLLASKEEATYETAVPFKPEDYEAFYTKAFGGEEDEEAEEEEEYEEEAAEVAEPEEKGFVEEEEEGGVEESEGEEDEADEEEGEVEGGGDEEEGEVVPRAAAPKSRKKRASAQKSANTYTNSSNVYASFPNVPPEEQLQEELEPTELTEPRRIQMLQSLQKLFAKILSPVDLAALERSIYNGTIRDVHQRHIPCHWKHPLFLHAYVTYARHMAANLHRESYVKNKELFDRYKKGDVSFADLCGMNSYDLFQSRWKDLFEQQQIREKRQLEGNKSMATDQFLCTRCWKRECTYYEMQTRSADEPMTIFITCLNCGKHWRQ